MALFPPDHPERIALAEEVHARPSEALQTPAQASYVAVLIDPDARVREVRHLQNLCRRQGVDGPPSGATHFRTQFQTPSGELRLKWERHGEFSSYTVIRCGDGSGTGSGSGASAAIAGAPPAQGLPPGWLAELPGTTMAAVTIEFVATAAVEPTQAGQADGERIAAVFGHQVVVGATVADGAARVYSDFRIHEDGCSRFLIFDHSLTPGQSGRLLQRLAEIEAYRTLALLALPIARRQSPRIVQIEQALARLTDGSALNQADDEALLQQLTQLAAEIESGLSASQFRFGACRAYDALVRRRIVELREQRLPGLQTIEEFMSRRFVPAVATCNTVSQRLHDLSERVAQASALLSTRVDILRERQNQSLLASMDRRAKLQLRLQQTVEGLSVAAITYYAVSLLGYLAKALKSAGLPLEPDLVTGIAVPLVAVAVLLAVRRERRRINRSERGRDIERTTIAPLQSEPEPR